MDSFIEKKFRLPTSLTAALRYECINRGVTQTEFVISAIQDRLGKQPAELPTKQTPQPTLNGAKQTHPTPPMADPTDLEEAREWVKEIATNLSVAQRRLNRDKFSRVDPVKIEAVSVLKAQLKHAKSVVKKLEPYKPFDYKDPHDDDEWVEKLNELALLPEFAYYAEMGVVSGTPYATACRWRVKAYYEAEAERERVANMSPAELLAEKEHGWYEDFLVSHLIPQELKQKTKQQVMRREISEADAVRTFQAYRNEEVRKLNAKNGARP